MAEKLKTFYKNHKVAVWVMGFGLFGLFIVHLIGSSLSELYAVDAIG